MHFTESCPSGRRSTIGNRVGVKSVSGVQIPDSPPVPSHGLLPPNGPCSIPCGGVAEWLNAAVSKTVYPVSPGTRVRIPPPPPVALFKRALAARFSLSIAKAQRSKASAAAAGGGAGRQRGLRCSRGRRKAAASCASPPWLSRRHNAGTQQPQRTPRASAAAPASRRTGPSAFPATLPLRQRSAGAARWKPAGSAASGRAHPMPRRAKCNPISHTAAAA